MFQIKYINKSFYTKNGNTCSDTTEIVTHGISVYKECLGHQEWFSPQMCEAPLKYFWQVVTEPLLIDLQWQELITCQGTHSHFQIDFI